MKKVLLFSNYGSVVPDIVKKIQNGIGDNSRTGPVIDAIEAIATDKCFSDSETLYDILKENPDKLYHIQNTDNYIGWCENIRNVAHVSIVEIDETKKWLVWEYDGAEDICELPEFELVDPKLNIYAEKGTNHHV